MFKKEGEFFWEDKLDEDWKFSIRFSEMDVIGVTLAPLHWRPVKKPDCSLRVVRSE